MKEQALAKHLPAPGQGTEQLPYRVLERLAARARRRCRGSRPPQAPPPVPHPPAPPASSPPPSPRQECARRKNPAPLWWRVAATAIPLLLLLAGLFVVDTVQQEQSVAELAEVDSALLTDDVPLVAYADHGFGVYIKNTRR